VAGRDANYYFQELYPWQDEIIQILSELDTQFYLTGGTAASRGYLGHRFSDDLDLFVNDDSNFPLWSARIIDACARSGRWTTRVLVREERYIRASLETAQDSLKLELVNDVPAHIGQIVAHPILGRLDSAENILANKISALIGREEPKDLADIWGFCCKLKMPLTPAVEDANSKAAGIFPADIARILCSTTERDWSLVRWIEPPEKDSFIADLYGLGETLLLDL
jgi:predicted nucleotidyltransferase component of viral defense system